jgi:hypothetical protein
MPPGRIPGRGYGQDKSQGELFSRQQVARQESSDKSRSELRRILAFCALTAHHSRGLELYSLGMRLTAVEIFATICWCQTHWARMPSFLSFIRAPHIHKYMGELAVHSSRNSAHFSVIHGDSEN